MVAKAHLQMFNLTKLVAYKKVKYVAEQVRWITTIFEMLGKLWDLLTNFQCSHMTHTPAEPRLVGT